MTTFRLSPRNSIGTLAVLCGLALAACSDFFTEPAPGRPVPIALSLIANTSAAGGSASAFDRADRVAIRVELAGEVLADTVMPVSAGGGDLRLRVEVDARHASATLTVHVELWLGSDRLFTGQGTIVPDGGDVAEAEIALEPVVSRIVAPTPAPTLDALGAQLQLAAAAVFATGDTVTDGALAYRALDPGVVDVSPAGLAVAVAAGTARVEASYGQVATVFDVTVNQAVATVDVDPPAATLFAGSTLQLTATPRDAGGHAIAGRPVAWSVPPQQAVTVTPGGLATGAQPGEATVTATVAGVSGTALITVVPLPPPMQPTALSAAASGTDVHLSWADNDTTETRHEVQRRIAAGGTFGTIATLAADATSHEDATGRADERFEYRVRACNAAGCTDSDPVTVETVPVAPALLQARITNVQARAFVLEWQDRSRFETHFLIERRTDPAEPWDAYAEVEAGATAFEGTGEPGVTDQFRVRACNGAGCSAPTNEVTVQHAGPAPAAPEDLIATADSTAVQLTWTDVATNEANYQVLRRAPLVSSEFLHVEFLDPNATEYLDQTGTPDELFEYVVRACNSGGCTPSDTASVTTVPVAPRELTPFVLDEETRAFTLQWLDESRFETHFVIEWRAGSGTPFMFYDQVPANVTQFEDVGVPGTVDFFRVLACNAAGCSPPSNEVMVEHGEGTPQATTLPSTGTAELRGMANGHASFYSVWFEWDYEESLFSQSIEFVEESALGVLTFSAPLSDVDQGSTIYYRIVASNEAGTGFGQVLSLDVPTLSLLPIPNPGDPVCNQDPTGVGVPQPCPDTPRSTVALTAETSGPAGTYQTPYARVDFTAFSAGTGTIPIGQSSAPSMADDGSFRFYTYDLDWTPLHTLVPPGTYVVEAFGVTPGGARVRGVGSGLVTVLAD